jgi:hypothetical protein
MGEFVTGLGGASPTSRAQHSYPDNPRASALALFARNFATGPKVNTAIGTGVQIPWNAIDTTAKAFSIAAGGVTVSIPGDVTALFNNGDNVRILPLVPTTLPVVTGSIATVPVFAAGVTTFDLNAPIDGSTVGGAIEDASTPSVDVPITPRSTGVVLVSAQVTVGNTSGSPVAAILVNVQVNGVSVPVPTTLVTPLANGATITLPVLVEVFLPIGVTSNIEIFVSGDGALLAADASSINIQEVSVATG